MSDRGVTSYTRAGSFGVDRDGFVVNSQQERLQIFPVASNGTFNTGTLSDLRLATADSAPQATTRTEFGINLPANAAVPSCRVRPGQRVELQPFDGRDDLRLARSLAHGDGVLRQDGDAEPMGRALLHRRRGRRRRERDDLLELGRFDGARRRRASRCRRSRRRTALPRSR